MTFIINPSRFEAAGGFSPDDVAELVGWWDPSDAGTITDAGGGKVSAMTDKSSSGNDLTQGTDASRPITGTRTINSLNVLDFTSPQHLVLDTAITFGNGGSGVTVFAVASKDAITNKNVVWGHSSDPPFLAFHSSSSSGAPYAKRSANVSAAASLATTNVGILHFSDDGATSSGVTKVGFDGGNIGTLSTSSGTVTWSGLGRYPNTAYQLDGRCGETLIVANYLLPGDADFDDIMTYLNDKWAVY